MSVRVEIPVDRVMEFFRNELPRREVFDQMYESGYPAVDYRVRFQAKLNVHGHLVEVYHGWISFRNEAEAVQFKLAHL